VIGVEKNQRPRSELILLIRTCPTRAALNPYKKMSYIPFPSVHLFLVFGTPFAIYLGEKLDKGIRAMYYYTIFLSFIVRKYRILALALASFAAMC